MAKLRVWWCPQVGACGSFYVSVSSPEEGRKVMDILSAYDGFQMQNGIKGDYSNVGGLEMFNEETGDWEDWALETEDDYFDDVDEYCDVCESAKEIEEFTKELFSQVDWEKIREMEG